MKYFSYTPTFTFQGQYRSKKDAMSAFKPKLKSLKNFAAAFNAECEIANEGFSQCDVPGEYIYSFDAKFTVILKGRLVFSFASACQTLANFNSIEISDEVVYPLQNENEPFE